MNTALELIKIAKTLLGFEFANKEEMDKYLKEHPDADKSNHWVKKQENHKSTTNNETNMRDSIQEAILKNPEFKNNLTKNSDFQELFKDSKVVDKQGSPLMVYHGTTSDFSEFNPSAKPVNDEGYMGTGSYFIENESHATSYADMAQENRPGTPRVMSVFLNIKNPYIMSEKDKQGTYGMKREDVTKWTDNLKKQGYDGVTNGQGEWVAFNPKQILIHSIKTVNTQGD